MGIYPNNYVTLANLMNIKRKVFISYHHAYDQGYREALIRTYAKEYEVFEDRSLDERYESNDAEYIRWQIRQNDIKGSSCSVVLCGAATYLRKHVDWEIKATLDFKHGLVAIILPTCSKNQNGLWLVPERLADCVQNGYGTWALWSDLSAQNLKTKIETAIACPQNKIVNSREMRQRNG